MSISADRERAERYRKAVTEAERCAEKASTFANYGGDDGLEYAATVQAYAVSAQAWVAIAREIREARA